MMNGRWWRCKVCQIAYARPSGAVHCITQHHKPKEKKIELELPRNLQIGDVVVLQDKKWYHNTGEDEWIYQELHGNALSFYYVVTSIEVSKNPKRFHLVSKAVKYNKNFTFPKDNPGLWLHGYVDGISKIRRVKNPPRAVTNFELGNYRARKSHRELI